MKRVSGALYSLSILSLIIFEFSYGDSYIKDDNNHKSDLLNKYINTLSYLVFPLIVSLLVTSFIFFLFGYDGSLPNHATVFSLVLAISLILKDKAGRFGANPPDRETA